MSETKQSKKKPIMIAIAVVAVMIAAAVPLILPASGNVQQPDGQWFYDVGTGELFDVQAGVLSPTAAPSGATLEDGRPGGVKAHVYACGSCDDADSRFVGYVTALTPEAAASPRGPLSMADGDMPAAVVDPQNPASLKWQRLGDLQPQINRTLSERCGTATPTACARKT